jgi:TPR repeat protein
MTKPLKFTVAALLLLSAVLAFFLTRPRGIHTVPWDGAALLAKAEQSLEGLPAKEASELRALLTSTGAGRYDDRAGAWIKTATKDDLKPVADYALASLRAMAEAGDAAAMWHLHFVLTQRIDTGDEGFRWLKKAAQQGYPRAAYDVTKEKLKHEPEKLRAAMEDFAKREDEAGMQALYWFAFGYEKGQDGLPKDAAKAADYRNRAKALGDKLYAAEKAK